MPRARLFLLVSSLVGVLAVSSGVMSVSSTGASDPVAAQQERGGRDPVKPVPWAKPAIRRVG